MTFKFFCGVAMKNGDANLKSCGDIMNELGWGKSMFIVIIGDLTIAWLDVPDGTSNPGGAKPPPLRHFIAKVF